MGLLERLFLRPTPHECVGILGCDDLFGWNHEVNDGPEISWRGVSRCATCGQAWLLIECGPSDYITRPITEEKVEQERRLVAAMTLRAELMRERGRLTDARRRHIERGAGAWVYCPLCHAEFGSMKWCPFDGCMLRPLERVASVDDRDGSL